MPTYKAPVDDVQFLLNDVFHMERYGNLPGFADATPDTLAAVLEEAAKLAEEVVQPLNRVGDWKAASATPTAASPRRPGSRKPTSNTPTAAGWAFPCRRNMAGRDCPAPGR